MPLTCTHSTAGLCDDCRAQRDADPVAWSEYGHHTRGEANWRALLAEMDAEAVRSSARAGDDTPF